MLEWNMLYWQKILYSGICWFDQKKVFLRGDDGNKMLVSVVILSQGLSSVDIIVSHSSNRYGGCGPGGCLMRASP